MVVTASSAVLPLPPTATSSSPTNTLNTDEACPAKPKPCCVCKPEKAARDECMLFSKSDNPQEDCKGTMEKYRDCMKGFGFTIP